MEQIKNTGDGLPDAGLQPFADLRIEGLTVYTDQFDPAQQRQITISFRVVNVGKEATARPFRTSIFPGDVRQESHQSILDIYYVNVPALAAGQTVYASRSITLPDGVNEFDIEVEVDVDQIGTGADGANHIARSHYKNPTPDIGRWVSIGPSRINDGGLGAIGRIHSIAVHPTTPSTMYVGGPNCGIWKTTNGGASWMPVGDSLPTLALAALAVDPVTPTRIYAVLAGIGIYCSQDGASTWTQVSADLGTPLGAGVLLIDPTMPSRLYLTAGSNGLYRSTDFGTNWTRVKTGFVDDLATDPSNPATLYGGVKRRRIQDDHQWRRW